MSRPLSKAPSSAKKMKSDESELEKLETEPNSDSDLDQKPLKQRLMKVESVYSI